MRKRTWYLWALVVTVAAGLASRRWPQVLPAALGKYPGDALWALMIFWGAGAIWRRASTGAVAAGAYAFCVAIELLKLWPAAWLMEIRKTVAGHLVFGHAFTWQNFFAYAVGVLAGAGVEILWSATAKRKADREDEGGGR